MYRRSFFNCLEAASCISGRNIPCPTRAACIVGMPNRSRGSTRQRREVQRLSEYPVGRGNPHGVNTGGADLRGDAMRHYSVVVDAYLTARAKTESVTGVHNDGLIGAMVAHKKL